MSQHMMDYYISLMSLPYFRKVYMKLFHFLNLGISMLRLWISFRMNQILYPESLNIYLIILRPVLSFTNNLKSKLDNTILKYHILKLKILKEKMPLIKLNFHHLIKNKNQKIYQSNIPNSIGSRNFLKDLKLKKESH